jgi:hypothetical protein
MSFPFELNEVYKSRQITRELKIGSGGGIRLSKSRNIVVLFSMPRHRRPEGGGNIYDDYYDEKRGYYYYSGTGRRGDQSFESRPNQWIRDAQKSGREIHAFRQSELKGPYQYLGQFEYVGHSTVERQPDESGKNRKVIYFKLKPVMDGFKNLVADFTEKVSEKKRITKGPHNLAPVLTIAEKSVAAEKLVAQHEESLGRKVRSVSLTAVGYDLESISKTNPSDVKYIEVKSRLGSFPVTLTTNEKRVAEEKGNKYYLYVVTSNETIVCLQNPVILEMEPRYVLHYQLNNWKNRGSTIKVNISA